jgi:hypothetical protein
MIFVFVWYCCCCSVVAVIAVHVRLSFTNISPFCSSVNSLCCRMLGKTTSVHALARELLGSHYKDAVLELNASDARGIDVRIPFFVVVNTRFVLCLLKSDAHLSYKLRLNISMTGGTESN